MYNRFGEQKGQRQLSVSHDLENSAQRRKNEFAEKFVAKW